MFYDSFLRCGRENLTGIVENFLRIRNVARVWYFIYLYSLTTCTENAFPHYSPNIARSSISVLRRCWVEHQILSAFSVSQWLTVAVIIFPLCVRQLHPFNQQYSSTFIHIWNIHSVEFCRIQCEKGSDRNSVGRVSFLLILFICSRKCKRLVDTNQPGKHLCSFC